MGDIELILSIHLRTLHINYVRLHKINRNIGKVNYPSKLKSRAFHTVGPTVETRVHCFM